MYYFIRKFILPTVEEIIGFHILQLDLKNLQKRTWEKKNI